MTVARPSGKRPYPVVVAPVSERHPALSASRPAVCILISDPERTLHLPIERLREIFGLTESEARLAALIAEGTDLQNAANELHITYGTARARLSEIFGKTRTHRQAELVKVLLTTPGVS